MKHTLLIVLSLTIAAPLAFADPDVYGVPDLGCQSPAEWRTHDYGAPETGAGDYLPQDGNTEPCPYGTGTWLDPAGDECFILGSEPETTRAHRALCVDRRPYANFDGDFEWAMGGAWLASRSGDGVTSGSLACWGVEAHHPVEGTVTVTEAIAPNVFFTVIADYPSPLIPSHIPPGSGGPDCGDGLLQPCDPTPPESSTLLFPADVVVDAVSMLLHGLLNEPDVTCNPWDQQIDCLNSCTVPFGPGQDGGYHVLVRPSLTADAGVPSVATVGHIHL